jgi:glycosyltransferase involved in cell wall biosynthesis
VPDQPVDTSSFASSIATPGSTAGDPPPVSSMVRRLAYLSGAPRVSTHPEAEASGARSHVLGTLGAFEQLGWKVERFIVGDALPQSWTTSGSQRVASRTFTRRLGADAMRLVLRWVNSRRVRRAFRGRVDLIYERFGAFQALGSACRQGGTPWVLETNGPLFYEAKVERKSLVLSALARRMERKAYRDCDLLVCISETLKGILVDSCGLPAEKVVVIPNGVDTAFFDPARYEPRRLFSGFTVGFVGNLYAWAGLNLHFEAVAELRQAGLEISTVVIGDGVMRERWENQVRSLGISDHVVFTGRLPQPSVPHYIAGFDVGYSGQVALQLGTMYGSPIKIYEYMSMAKPAIASAFWDAQRVIHDDIDGFLFAPNDKESLKATLHRAYNAQEGLARMGAAARAEVVAHHSWTARARSLLDAIDRLQPTLGPSSRSDGGSAPLRETSVP